MLETPVAERRRVAGIPSLHRGLAEDFAADEPAGAVRGKRSPGVRITLPNGFPGSVLGRIAVGMSVAAIFGVLVFVLWQARHYLRSDARLVLASASSIQITGNRHLTRADLLGVLSDQIDRNILTVSLAEQRESLEQVPWVEHATVMRLLPNRLQIAITERTPVAFYRQGTHVGLVDTHGILLDLHPDSSGSSRANPTSSENYSFPVISGIAAIDSPSVRAARMKMFERFMTELRDSGDGIADRLSEVDLSSPEDIKALIPAGSSDILVHFGEDHFLERYRRLQENLPKWKTDYPRLASADMRYPRQVVLEMAAGTAVPVTSGHPPVDSTSHITPRIPVAHPRQGSRVPAAHGTSTPGSRSTAPSSHLSHEGPQ